MNMASAVAPSYATPTTAAPSQHPYTCNTCQVAFKGSDLQRSHMQSDWHRYNLKRRVASLPPLTSEIFAEKVLANQASAAATAARASFEKICTVCQRTYFSENAYQNHLGSQKHRARLAQVAAAPPSTITDDETSSMMSSAFSLGEPIDTVKHSGLEDSAAEEEFSKVVDSLKQTSLEGEDPLPGRPSRPVHSAQTPRPEHPLSPTTATDDSSTTDEASTTTGENEGADSTLRCLFCNNPSASIETNVIHMQSKHGMFVPEQPYLVDLKGLIGWLHERIHILHECLYCGTLKHTTSGIQTHMRDKGHCMIAFESEKDMIEVGQFYDFRSSYSDGEEESDEETSDAEPGNPKLGAKRSAKYIIVKDGNNAEDDDAEMIDSNDGEWESEDENEDEISEDDDTTDDTTSDRTQTPRNPQPRAYQEDHELHLPTGRTAGHRSLARYYRQNLHNYPTPAERASRLAITDGNAEDETSGRGRRQQQQMVTRANGGLGLAGAPEAKRREAAAVEVRDKRRQQRAEKRYQWGNDKQGNFQKHFRDPLLQ